MDIRLITVAGGGVMGRQIALNAAIHGFDAVLYDISADVLDNAKAWAQSYLDGRVEKGRLSSDEAAAAGKRFRIDNNLASAVKDADIVFEAIVEKEEIKKSFFRQLCPLIREDTIIATNSSYMPSSLFAESVANPARLANCHFYNPVLVMKFVEVVQGPHTSSETGQTLFDFCTACGKKPILMKKEIRGFAANYLLEGLQDRARTLVAGGYCTPEEVDMAAELALNHPIGPIRLMDFTGLDTKYDIYMNRYGDTDWDMRNLFEEKIKEGKLGKKTGEGFYKYDK